MNKVDKWTKTMVDAVLLLNNRVISSRYQYLFICIPSLYTPSEPLQCNIFAYIITSLNNWINFISFLLLLLRVAFSFENILFHFSTIFLNAKHKNWNEQREWLTTNDEHPNDNLINVVHDSSEQTLRRRKKI